LKLQALKKRGIIVVFHNILTSNHPYSKKVGVNDRTRNVLRNIKVELTSMKIFKRIGKFQYIFDKNLCREIIFFVSLYKIQFILDGK